LNSYLQLEDSNTSASVVELPEAVRDIRLALEADRARVGFRYGHGWWSSVVSVEFRAWLVAGQTNVVALELCSFRAGALPLGTQVLLDYIAEAARRQNIEVAWSRHHGDPLALLHFQASQPRLNTLLRRL